MVSAVTDFSIPPAGTAQVYVHGDRWVGGDAHGAAFGIGARA
jgi:hypothetical protein